MKRILFSFLFITFAFVISAQSIKYDTIRVSPDDERNIHRGKSLTVSAPPPRKQTTNNKTQTAHSTFDKSKLRYGANLGLSLSRNYTSINIGPQLGYQLTNHFLIGAGVKYYYTKVRGYQYNTSTVYKNNLLGVNAFGYLYPVSFITIFAQPEINYLWSHYIDESTGDTRNSTGAVPSVLVGAGIRLGRTHLTLNYDLVQHVNSPYSRGVFFGVSVFF